MMRSWIEDLMEIGAPWDLCLRITLWLGSAWVLHGLLARSHPSWRVQLWRLTTVAIVAIGCGALLPGLAVSIEPPARQPAAGTTSADQRNFRSHFPRGAAATGYGQLTEGIVWESKLFPESPAPAVETVRSATEGRSAHLARWCKQHWPELLWSVWIVGAGVLATFWIGAQIRLRALLSRCIPVSADGSRRLRTASRKLGVGRPVRAMVSREVEVPCVAGWRHPVIVLPAKYAHSDCANDWNAILAHELMHVRSRDLFWMGIVDWIALLLWFHPLAWRIRSRHAMACEEAADAAAAASVGDVMSYSATLARVALSAVGFRPGAAAISMARSPEIMSRLKRLERGASGTPVGRGRVAAFAVLGLLTALPLAGLRFAHGEQATTAEDDVRRSDVAGMRVLEFPNDHAVGTVEIATDYVDEDWERYATRFDYRRTWDWQHLGPAQGTVLIPAGAKVKLTLKSGGASDLSWVDRLRPDDVYELVIYPDPHSADIYLFGDEEFRQISRLSGLKELRMRFVQVTDGGIRRLESFTDLEVLNLYAPECGNACLQSIGKLTALRVLEMGLMPWTDEGLLHLSNLTQLEEVDLVHTGPPGRGFDALVQLPNLKQIGGHTFVGEHLARLKNCKALRALNMDSNRVVTDAALKQLPDLPQLEYLQLNATNITDAGVRHLRALKSLKQLGLHVTHRPDKPALTAVTAEVLAQMPALEIISLPNVGDADAFLEKLSSLPNLESLLVSSRRDTGLFSDSGIRHLAGNKRLNRLSLGESTFTNEAAASLATLTGLTHLSFDAGQMTEEGLSRLSALRNLEYLQVSCNPKRGRMPFSGVAKLNGLTNLRDLWYMCRHPLPGDPPLDLSGLSNLEAVQIVGFRDQDLPGIAGCTSLKSLSASHVTDNGLSAISGLTSLHTLNLEGAGITDAGLVHLQEMQRLDRLTLRGSLSDDALPHLARLKSLGVLHLSTTGTFSNAAVSNLRASLTNLRGFTVDDSRAREAQKNQLRVGQTAPAFQVKSLEGDSLKLSDYRGKVVLLYFWSTSCAPCVTSMPKTKAAYLDLSKYEDFAMIGLSGDAFEPPLRQFVKRHELPWPQVRIGEDSQLAANYGITGYPTYILVGRDGKVLCTRVSELDATLRKELDIPEEDGKQQ